MDGAVFDASDGLGILTSAGAGALDGELPGDDLLKRERGVGLEIADEDDRAVFAYAADGEIERGSGSDDFEAGVGSVATEVLAKFGGETFFLGIEGGLGTKGFGEFETTVVEIDGDDALPSAGFEGLNDKKTDESGTDDDGAAAHRLVGGRGRVEGFTHIDAFGEVDAMKRDGDRLGKGRLFEFQGLGEAIEDAGGQDDLFGEATVAAILGRRDAEDFALGAEIDVTGLALVAVAAVLGRVKGDAVTDGPAGDAFAQFADFARSFVAHDDGREAASTPTVHAVDVAAANATGVDADFDFARAGLRVGEVRVVVELGRGGEDEGVHGRKAEIGKAEARRINELGSQRL